VLAFHELFRGAHGQPALGDLARDGLLAVRGEAEQGACMAHFELTGLDAFLHALVELLQAQQIADAGARTPDGLGNLLVGEAEVVDQAGNGTRLFERVQVLTLDVFNERDGGGGLVREVAHDPRHGLEAGDLGGAPAALAGDQFITLIHRAHHHGLDHALGAEGVGEFLQGVGIEMAPGLVAAAADAVDRQHAQGGAFFFLGDLGH